MSSSTTGLNQLTKHMDAFMKKGVSLKETLQILLTPAEVDDLLNRILILKQVHKQRPQRDVASELGVSISKVSRGALAYRSHHALLKKVWD